MSGRIVSAQEARTLLDGSNTDEGVEALVDASPDLAFTVEQQAAQIAAVKAPLDKYGETDEDGAEFLAAPEDSWRMFRDVRAALGES